VDWGGKCENSTECKQGLLCEDGVCETAPSCDVDSDCTTGKCTDGKCDVGDDVASSAGPYKKNWLGLHYGLDLAIIGGSNVCGADGGYECYEAGSRDAPYQNPPYPGTGIATGLALGTQRIMLSYDRAFTHWLSAGVRVGYALFGGPPAIDAATGGEIAFLPIHAEGRITIWLAPGGLSRKPLRPYVTLGGGMAQVDAKVPVTVSDCDPARVGMRGSGPMDKLDECETAVAPSMGGVDPDTLEKKELDAWKKLGQGFVMGGAGLVFAFKDQVGVQVNAQFLYMLGSSGPVIQPSLGFVYGL
jgi:hypothetical protein